MIHLSVISEFYKLKKDFGYLTKKSLENIITVSHTLNLTCLSFINFESETYFNNPQCKEIQEEIKILSKNPTCDKRILAKIKKAADIPAKNVHILIKFTPTNHE